MKNVKYLGFVGLGCAALLLTGCGESSNTLTCTKKESNLTQEIVYEFDSKGEKITGSEMYVSTEIPEGTSDEDVEQAKALLEGMFCSSDMVEDCKTTVSGNKLEFKASASEEALEEEEGTKEELKKQHEDDGYTCK